ncbi:MAG: hypothetical protein AB7W59_14165 [Acidimicrobiia bacterium]
MTARTDVCAVCLSVFERPRRGSGKRYCGAKCRKRAELTKRKAAKGADLERLADGAIVERGTRRYVMARGHALADGFGLVDVRKRAAHERLGGAAGCEVCGDPVDGWRDVFWRKVEHHLVATCRTCSATVTVVAHLGIDPTPVLMELTGLVLPPQVPCGGSIPAPVRPDEGTTAATDLRSLARLGAQILPSVRAVEAGAAEVVAAVLVAHQWGDFLASEEV